MEETLPRLTPAAVAAPIHAVVIAPFANDPIRDLDAARIWRALAAAPALAGAPVRLLGSASQGARLEAFRRQAPPEMQARCVVVAGEPAEHWLALVGGARLVVACESAIAHAAAALDRPLVALLGGGHPGLFAPWSHSRRQHWLTHAEPCYGCDWRCPHPEPFCLTRISDDEVARAVRAALAPESPTA